ncbi:MAG: DUF4097 family beta strand repeat-containing protein [Planctomycetota bacterium]
MRYGNNILGFLVCLSIAVTGCHIQIGPIAPQAKYERTVRLSAPMPAKGSFSARTHNGSVSVVGAEVVDCRLVAKIAARAGSEQEAQRLAEATEIALEAAGSGLMVRIAKPVLRSNRSICVSLDATVPKQTGLELRTNNGAVELSNIVGRIDGVTNNGNVSASDVYGTCNLRTHNGSINCRAVSGNLELVTHNGNVRVEYSPTAVPVCNASATTHNGWVDFTAPSGLSAVVELSTHNGSVETELPLTVIGKISPREVKGTIGTGQGRVHLKTYNGWIKLKK